MRFLAILLLVSITGCSASSTSVTVPAPPPVVTVAPTPKLPPFLLHLPGIGGARSLDRGMVHGLQLGGFTGQVQIYDWTGKNPGLAALLQTERDHQQAKFVADLLTARFDADPLSRMILICHSGGGGIAVWALEDLPARVKIDTLLMLAPALSPGYDLSKALSHVSHRAYVFSSLDDPVCGLGCRLFGTIDGVKTDAAGRVGFTMPPGAETAEYQKLIAMPYQQDWMYFDDYGDHVGAMTRKFAHLALAPLILTGRMPSTQPTDATTQTSTSPVLVHP